MCLFSICPQSFVTSRRPVIEIRSIPLGESPVGGTTRQVGVQVVCGHISNHSQARGKSGQPVGALENLPLVRGCQVPDNRDGPAIKT